MESGTTAVNTTDNVTEKAQKDLKLFSSKKEEMMR